MPCFQADFVAIRPIAVSAATSTSTAAASGSFGAVSFTNKIPTVPSTTIAKLLQRIGLLAPICARVQSGMPVYGTCAGMILMAMEIEDRPHQPTLALMDITVARNAFGRQVDSFEAEIVFSPGGDAQGVRGVFIRAPFVTRTGPMVEVVATYEGRVVGVREGMKLATAFHPELTDNDAVHAFFAGMVAESQEIR